MTYSSRFFLYAPIALVLLIAAAVSWHWSRTANAVEARLAAIKGHEALPGITLDWSKAEVSGFPFRIDVVFEGLSARGQGARGPFRWDSEHFALHSLTYGADKDVFEAAGVQRLSWTDAAERKRDFAFKAGSLHASAVRDSKGLARFDVDIVQLASQKLSLGRAQLHVRRTDATIDMMVSADVGKGDLGFYYGQGFKTIRLYHSVHGAGAFAALLKGQVSPAAAHETWHHAGGMAAVTATEIDGRQNGMTPEQGGTIVELLEALY